MSSFDCFSNLLNLLMKCWNVFRFTVGKLSEQYAQRGHHEPIAALWAYHFVCGNDDSMSRIFNNHLKDRGFIKLDYIMKSDDMALLEKLLKFSENTKWSSKLKRDIGNRLDEIRESMNKIEK